MSKVFRGRIDDPAAWSGPEVENDPRWLMRLDDADVAEIDAAVRHAKDRGLTIPFDLDDFPLPTVGAKLGELQDRLDDGLGFVFLRGLFRERYDNDECGLIYWGIAVHLGTPVSQNTRGHLIGHVRDEGKSLEDPTARGYQTTQRLGFHTDQLPVDVLGLFCLRTAKSGGASTLVSGLAVHEVLREERPDLLEALYEPFPLDWRGEEPEGEDRWYTSPVFGHVDGKVSVRMISIPFYESAARHGDSLALSDVQREALHAVQDVANRPQLRLSMDFQKGDMQFLNNHVILHARESYEDHEEPDRKRHLMRLWIEAPRPRQRPLPPGLEDRRRYVRSGGIPAKV